MLGPRVSNAETAAGAEVGVTAGAVVEVCMNIAAEARVGTVAVAQADEAVVEPQPSKQASAEASEDHSLPAQ